MRKHDEFYAEGLKRLRTLKPAQIGELENALRQEQPIHLVPGLARSVAAELNWEYDLVLSIVRALAAIHNACSDANKERVEITKSLLEIGQEEADAGSALPTDQFEQTILSLLSTRCWLQRKGGALPAHMSTSSPTRGSSPICVQSSGSMRPHRLLLLR